MEFIKYSGFPIKYHPGKMNVLTDTLTRKTALVNFLIAEGSGLMFSYIWMWIFNLSMIEWCLQACLLRS